MRNSQVLQLLMQVNRRAYRELAPKRFNELAGREISWNKLPGFHTALVKRVYRQCINGTLNLSRPDKSIRRRIRQIIESPTKFRTLFLIYAFSIDRRGTFYGMAQNNEVSLLELAFIYGNYQIGIELCRKAQAHGLHPNARTGLVRRNVPLHASESERQYTDRMFPTEQGISYGLSTLRLTSKMLRVIIDSHFDFRSIGQLIHSGQLPGLELLERQDAYRRALDGALLLTNLRDNYYALDNRPIFPLDSKGNTDQRLTLAELSIVYGHLSQFSAIAEKASRIGLPLQLRPRLLHTLAILKSRPVVLEWLQANLPLHYVTPDEIDVTGTRSTNVSLTINPTAIQKIGDYLFPDSITTKNKEFRERIQEVYYRLHLIDDRKKVTSLQQYYGSSSDLTWELITDTICRFAREVNVAMVKSIWEEAVVPFQQPWRKRDIAYITLMPLLCLFRGAPLSLALIIAFLSALPGIKHHLLQDDKRDLLRRLDAIANFNRSRELQNFLKKCRGELNYHLPAKAIRSRNMLIDYGRFFQQRAHQIIQSCEQGLTAHQPLKQPMIGKMA